MKTFANDQAFPVEKTSSTSICNYGLTKREYITIEIMKALIITKYKPESEISFKARKLADNLIKQINLKKK